MTVPRTGMTALDWAMVGVLTLVVAVGTGVGSLAAMLIWKWVGRLIW